MWATIATSCIAWFFLLMIVMRQLLQNMSDQELIDRLAELTDHLSSCRGINASYEFCKMDIEETQREIEDRMLKRDGRLTPPS